MYSTPFPEAIQFGYTGDMGWRNTPDWHRWKIAQCLWMIGYEKHEIEEHERKIREMGGTA